MHTSHPKSPPGTEDRRNGTDQENGGPNLLPQHRALLEARGISSAIAVARGYRSVTLEDDALVREHGFVGKQRRFPSLLIPIRNPAGRLVLHQLRPDQPRIVKGRPVKYESPAEIPPALDVPPVVREQLGDPTIALFVTEGPLKADAGASHGLAVVGLAGVWSWRGGNDLGGKRALADWDLVALNGRLVYLVFDSDVVSKASVAKALARLKGLLEGYGAACWVIYLPSTPDGRKVGLDDYLVQGHSTDELLSLAEPELRPVSPEPATPTDPASPEQISRPGHRPCTDLGNAERFDDRWGREVRYSSTLGAWLIWDGKRWRQDDAGRITQLGVQVIRMIWLEAAGVDTKERRQELAAHAHRSESAARIDAMLVLARSFMPLEDGIRSIDALLDPDPWPLNCRNGTVDLRDGSLRPHNPTDWITRLVDLDYRPAATCPRWERFLEEILPDPATRAFVHRALGYSATGSAREREVIVAWGSGRNGKGTLVKQVAGILGEYAARASTEVVLMKRPGAIPTDIAELRGRRLVYLSESGEGRRLDEAALKDLTGGEDIPARHLYGRWFSFRPSFTPWILTNHKPIVRGSDEAIWDRLNLVPFTRRFRKPDDPEDGAPPADPRLDEYLEKERPGILGWLIRGAVDWYRSGLPKPEAVRAATSAYREEMDAVGEFLSEICSTDPQAWVTAGALYKAYADWVSGEKPLSSIAFGQRLIERGYRADRRYVAQKQTRIWCGIGLIDPSAGPSPETPPDPPQEPQQDTRDIARHGFQETSLISPSHRGFLQSVSPLSRVSRSTGTGDVSVPGQGKNVAETQDTDPAPYTLIRTTEALQSALPVLMHADVIALDVETAIAEGTTFDLKKNQTALNPRRGRLRLIQLGIPAHTFIIDAFAVDSAPLAPLFAGPAEFVAHNATFELGWLRAAGLPLPQKMTDTMVLAKLVDAGRFADNHKPYSLASVVARHLGQALNKAAQLSDWSAAELSEQQLAYAALDVEVLRPLAVALKEAITAGGLEVVAELELALLPFMAALEANGMPVDRDRWIALAEAAAAERDAIEPELRGLLGNPISPKTGEPIPLSAGPQLGAAFEAIGTDLPKTKKGRPSTTEAVLKAREDRHPAVARYLAWRHAKTLATTFGPGWLGNEVDGRVRAHFHQLGTVTGRTASSRPNLQQVPSAAPYRRCFAAPPGRILVRADLAQVQVCCAAELSGDTKLIEALNAGPDHGGDVHRLSAAALYGKRPEDVTPAERAFGKIIVFGTLFGQGVAGFMGQAAERGLGVSEREVRTFLDRFDRAWPRLARWRREQMRRTDTEIRSSLGRVRYVSPDVRGTIRVNSPIQMMEADGVKHAMVLLAEQRAVCPSAQVVNFVHDELVYEVDEAEAPKLVELIRQCLQDGMRRVISKVVVRVDVETSPTWAKEDGA